MDIKPPGNLEINFHEIELMNFLQSQPNEELCIVTIVGNQKKSCKCFSTESRKFLYGEKLSFTKTFEEIIKIECVRKEKASVKTIAKIIIPIQPVYTKKKVCISVFLMGNKGKFLKIDVQMKFFPDEAFFGACLILKNFAFMKKFSSNRNR
jgi:hypothetical protein